MNNVDRIESRRISGKFFHMENITIFYKIRNSKPKIFNPRMKMAHLIIFPIKLKKALGNINSFN